MIANTITEIEWIDNLSAFGHVSTSNTPSLPPATDLFAGK